MLKIYQVCLFQSKGAGSMGENTTLRLYLTHLIHIGEQYYFAAFIAIFELKAKLKTRLSLGHIFTQNKLKSAGFDVISDLWISSIYAIMIV